MTRAPSPIVLNPPTGTSKLPVFEFPETEINKPKGQRASVKQCSDPVVFSSNLLGDTDCDDLSLSAWPFFHAAAKTELASSFSKKQSELHGMMMSGMHGDMLRWKPKSLRVRRRGILSRKDASRSYLSGRFGEACTYLFMLSQGYVYWDHLPTLVDRSAGIHANHPERVRRARVIKSKLNLLRQSRKALNNRGVLEQPDFAFEKSNGQSVLVESKGRMVSPGVTPNFKGDLKKALAQIQTWQSIVSGARKAYAVATYLREVGDGSDESLLVFVDPPGNDNGEPLATLNNDEIRRGNYAAWLGGMGLLQSASALAFSETVELPRIELPIFRVGNMDFVIPAGMGLLRYERWLHRIPIEDWFRWLHFDASPFLGLEVAIARTLEATIAANTFEQNRSLTELRPVEFNSPEGFYGNVFPDGSLLASASKQIRFQGFGDFRL